MALKARFTRQDMVDAGWLPIAEDVDPDSINGPPELMEAINFFCQHGTLDGWARLEALSEHSSDYESDASKLPNNRPRATVRHSGKRYRGVQDRKATIRPGKHRRPQYTRQDMVASGWLPIDDGVDPDSITGPPELLEAIDFFCQHGTLDGWERLEALSEDSSDYESDASDLIDNRPGVTAQDLDKTKKRYQKVQDNDTDGRREGPLLSSGPSEAISTIPTSPEVSFTPPSLESGKLTVYYLWATHAK